MKTKTKWENGKKDWEKQMTCLSVASSFGWENEFHRIFVPLVDGWFGWRMLSTGYSFLWLALDHYWMGFPTLWTSLICWFGSGDRTLLVTLLNRLVPLKIWKSPVCLSAFRNTLRHYTLTSCTSTNPRPNCANYVEFPAEVVRRNSSVFFGWTCQ